MPLNNHDLDEILKQNPRALALFVSGPGNHPRIVLIMDLNHPIGENPVPLTFRGFPLTTRYVQAFRVQPPADPEATVDLPEPEPDLDH